MALIHAVRTRCSGVISLAFPPHGTQYDPSALNSLRPYVLWVNGYLARAFSESMAGQSWFPLISLHYFLLVYYRFTYYYIWMCIYYFDELNIVIARKSILPQCIIIVEPQCPWRACNLRDRSSYNKLVQSFILIHSQLTSKESVVTFSRCTRGISVRCSIYLR